MKTFSVSCHARLHPTWHGIVDPSVDPRIPLSLTLPTTASTPRWVVPILQPLSISPLFALDSIYLPTLALYTLKALTFILVQHFAFPWFFALLLQLTALNCSITFLLHLQYLRDLSKKSKFRNLEILRCKILTAKDKNVTSIH